MSSNSNMEELKKKTPTQLRKIAQNELLAKKGQMHHSAYSYALEKALNTKTKDAIVNVISTIRCIDASANTYKKANGVMQQIRQNVQEAGKSAQALPKEKMEIYFELEMYHRIDNSKYNTKQTTSVIMYDGETYSKDHFGHVVDIEKYDGQVYKAFYDSQYHFSGDEKFLDELRKLGGHILTADDKLTTFFELLKKINEDDFKIFKEKYSKLFSSEYSVDLIEIRDIKVRKANSSVTNYNKVMAHDDARNACFSFKYISYNSGYEELTKNVYHSDYVNENLVRRSCWFSTVLDVYRESFKKSPRYNIEIDYEWLFKKVYPDLEFNPEGDNPSCFDDMVNGFFKKFNLGVYMFNINYEIVAFYEPEGSRNKNLNPNCLYVLYHDNHIYQMNHQINSLNKILGRFKETKDLKPPSNTFHLPNEREISYLRVTCKDDIVQIINNEIQGDVHAICEDQSLFSIWSEFYCDDELKFECNLSIHNEDITGFKMLNVKIFMFQVFS